MSTDEQFIIRAGDTASGVYQTDITPERAGWAWSGLKVLQLSDGQSHELATGDDELLVLPLAGGCTVGTHDADYRLHGREDVFTGVTDFLYIPREATLTIRSGAGATIALPTARAQRALPVRYYGPTHVTRGVRGAGMASRQVNNYALGNEVVTDHLLVTEVLTPGGNWSSYPPHKHDEHTAHERELEEIYYFRVRSGPQGPGFAFHRTYGTTTRPIDIAAEVRSGDVVLTPHGYHGPSMAAPGYDLYYLNVMAGPAEDRQWLVTHDPAHDWVREAWNNQEPDPRLPMTRTTEQGRS